MQRREFVTLLRGAAVAWPLAAHAQPGEGVRRIAVLMASPETDPEAKALLSEFTQGLAGLGWADGRNIRMDVRWAASNLDLIREFSKELVDLQPDAILANSTPATAVEPDRADQGQADHGEDDHPRSSVSDTVSQRF
jgi:putative tryptophan/tyrosine transport system substrate-binding protein